jgi:DNA-binding CsgD family transcriptional regulator
MILSAFLHKYNNVLFATVRHFLLCCHWEDTDLPRKSPYRVVLTEEERDELERRSNKYTLPYFMVARAKMILFAQQGLSNDEIADRLSTRREIVSRWRKRFFEKRLAGLEDSERPGRPRVFPPRTGRAR